MNNLRIGTATVHRMGFSELKVRLELLGLCLLKAGHKKCNIVVFPGGYFRVARRHSQGLEHELKQRVQASGIPCIVGVDFTEEPEPKSEVIPQKSVRRLGQNKRERTQTGADGGSAPEVWVVSRSVQKFQEIWGRSMKAPPRARHALAGMIQVLPLCCGDVFIRELTVSREQPDLIAVTAHWSIWPIQWIGSLKRAALANRAVVALAQHLVVLPGRNYVYDQRGNPCKPAHQKWLKVGLIGACLRVFEIA